METKPLRQDENARRSDCTHARSGIRAPTTMPCGPPAAQPGTGVVGCPLLYPWAQARACLGPKQWWHPHCCHHPRARVQCRTRAAQGLGTWCHRQVGRRCQWHQCLTRAKQQRREKPSQKLLRRRATGGAMGTAAASGVQRTQEGSLLHHSRHERRPKGLADTLLPHVLQHRRVDQGLCRKMKGGEGRKGGVTHRGNFPFDLRVTELARCAEQKCKHTLAE